MAVSQMSTTCPSRARVSLISSEYPTWCRSTLEPCCHDLTRVFMYLSCSVIQENVIFDRVEDWFSLEVLTPMGDVVLDIGIWESYFSFSSIRSSRWIKKIKEWSPKTSRAMKHNPILQGAMPPMREKMLHGKLRSFLLSMVSISSFLRDQCIIHHFLFSPSFCKCWNEISFKGGGL
jgi:hypothetical protein